VLLPFFKEVYWMLKMLSQKSRTEIHEAGMKILGEVGVRIHNKKIYDMLLDAGAVPCKSDPERVYMPDNMVKEFLDKCPSEFQIKNRKGEATLVKNGASPLYYTSNATHYVRGTSKKAVEIGEKELTEFVRVVDKLENVQGIVGTGIREYAPRCRDFAGFKLMAKYSYKHLRPCIYTPSGAEAIVEMADVILDGKPLKENMFFTLGYSVVSPLAWSDTALELFYRTRGHGIPMMINSEPMAGGTSPVTLAGSLALADAEVLSGIVINQVIEPGRPCLYNAGFAHVLDMMTAMVLTGSPENALLQAAGAEMAEFHGLPCASWCLSDSVMLDSQASFEKMITLLAHTLSNVNMVWGIGNIETSKTISPEAAVIDNEMIGTCLRFAKGIDVDAEHIAYDVIKDTVFKGSFLDTDHTLEYFREEIRHTPLPNRVNRLIWESKGSKSIEEKAEDIVNNILSKETEIYLSGTQMEKLERIQKKWTERG
jgi:trimethylamine--corrinoid protein Co-methyltransferase